MKKSSSFYIGKVLILVGFLILLDLALPFGVQAQNGEPPPGSTSVWKGQVTGKITNGTPGASVPEKVDVMLHGWTESEEKIMLHGQSAQDGSFLFADVDFDPNLFYTVMATYKDVTYTSESAQVKAGDLTLSFDTPVYEITNDLLQVKIDPMHVLFFAHEGELMVTEVYILSNAGDRTVKDTLTLPSGRKGSLKFPLPDEASNVEFDDQSGQRFIQVDGGFVDTAPIVPGEKDSQVMVRYNLPYTGELLYNFTAPVAVDGLNFLIPIDSGIKLQGSTLTSEGVKSMQDGSSFNIYSSPGLDPAKSIQVSLAGKPTTGNAAFSAPTNLNQGIAIGGSLLGLALVGVGIWWWRRSKEENTGMSLDDILIELEELDEAYAREEISEEEYQETHSELRARMEQALRERADEQSELT